MQIEEIRKKDIAWPISGVVKAKQLDAKMIFRG
jgi:hypothetical protein